MNSKKIFIFGCIPARLLLVLLIYKINQKYLPYFSIFLFAIGISFIYLYITNSRLNAPEAGGKTWWKNLRPVHGILYLLAAILSMMKNRLAALILLIDVIFGTGAFLIHSLS